MIEILRSRRSIRKYEKKSIHEEAVKILKEALLRCPSSRGFNPWTFIFVDEPGLLERLSKAKEHGSAFINKAALAIVICGDETRSDVWIEDCSIAAIIAHLTAHSLGLGSCWVQIRNRFHSSEKSSEAYVQELLGIPPNIKVEAIISLGFPGETPKPIPDGQLDYGKIRTNHF
jgi:nitroreductase